MKKILLVVVLLVIIFLSLGYLLRINLLLPIKTSFQMKELAALCEQGSLAKITVTKDKFFSEISYSCEWIVKGKGYKL